MLAGCAVQDAPEQPAVQLQQEQIIKQNMTGETPGGESMKVLFIIAQNNFRDEELSVPKGIIEKAGYDVEVASLTTGTAAGMLGAKVKPDLAVKEVDTNKYEYVVVVGGSGSALLAQDPDVIKVVSNAKNVGGICLGSMTLAKAGVLYGKKATGFNTSELVNAMDEGGATYTGEEITVDGTTVTASGPKAAERFGRKIVEVLEEER